ncbi:MAG: cell division protein ZapE [Micropepsaceae bacterium]
MTKDGPLARYRALLSSGTLREDREQARVAKALQKLHRAVRNYRPASSDGFLQRIFRFGSKRAIPRGLYIHGAVGRGKSLLMDMFFESAEVECKRRVHFNAFMAETHKRLHEWRIMSAAERVQRPEFVREASEDPIAPIAKRICNESWLICFDEFQVGDVADAMILGRLFEKLLSFGAVIVLTSNCPPRRLYEGGLNRQLFLPFIALLRERLKTLELDGGRDYRLQRMAGVRLYNTPLTSDTARAMDGAWEQLINGVQALPRTLEVFGRELDVPLAANGAARFTFDELCGRPLAAADYVALAENFHTILLDEIPALKSEDGNEARRFSLLIDTLYDEKIKFICSAAVLPNELHDSSGKNSWFKRTSSRLHEMQSKGYLRQTPREKNDAEKSRDSA